VPSIRKLRRVDVRSGAPPPTEAARQRDLERLERTYGDKLGPLPAGARRHRWYDAYREVAGAEDLLDASVPCDCFAQLGTAVAALYTDSIRSSEEPLLSRCGTVVIFSTEQLPPHPVWVADGDLESFHSVHVPVDRHLVEMSVPEAKHVVLEQIHAGLRDLASLLDWPTTPLEAAHQLCLERRLTYEWDGPVKHSPDRRHRAIPRFALTDEGYGRAVIEVHDRSGQTIVTTEALPAYPTIEGFRRAAKTLRWRDATTVTMVSYLVNPRDPSFKNTTRQPTELRLPGL
jgi:hypothetical protein